MSNLHKLLDCGQSYWLDNLTRAKIKEGELEKRVKEEGLRGITSNPKIFDKAISKSNDYDDQIKELVDKGCTVHEIYESLVVQDIQDACDILRTVYEESKGIDGFVSLEVSPYLAHDTEGSINEARRLFEAVGRPNCFIKIPGTKEGIPAIEECLYQGLNINITLLFSIEDYEAVAHAYINALERRMNEGKTVDDIASVASFFLSRIDVLADQVLNQYIDPGTTTSKEINAEQLMGKVAVANAKMAYQSFKKIFRGERWNKLAEKGARVQRPLWASTSTKDALYKDVRYVEPLIGWDTVNTMPDKTIKAFADHGIVKENTVEEGVEEARQILENLGKLNVDLNLITRQLINEGIQKFMDPFDQLMTTIAKKRMELMDGEDSLLKLDSGEVEPYVADVFKSLETKQFVARLFAKDPYLWNREEEHVKVIKNRLGWLDSFDNLEDNLEELQQFTEEAKDKFNNVVLLGMGGSSLCSEVVVQTFGSATGFPKLTVLDDTGPESLESVTSTIDFDKTLFIVASKSGTTLETISFYKYFFEKVKQRKGEKAGENFIAITDPGTPLEDEAEKNSFLKVFKNPEDIGGRYSVLSYFGLVPMALIGMDLKELYSHYRRMKKSCEPPVPASINPAVMLGAALGAYAKKGRDKVTFILSESLSSFGLWAEQLIAESTGKEGKGIIPIHGEKLFDTDRYREDRVFVNLYLKGERNHDTKSKLDSLKEQGHPVIEIDIEDKMALGAEFYRWEVATATAGAVLLINPFDEPNVAESKKNTRDLLQEWEQQKQFKAEEKATEYEGIELFYHSEALSEKVSGGQSINVILNAFLDLAREKEYIAFLPYFMHKESRHKELENIRRAIGAQYKVATMLGHGPRYLHSTGQLHKGGPANGLFILLTAKSGKQIEIPGKPYDFSVLQYAQALGDFRSLKDKGYDILHIRLTENIDQKLGLLKNIIEESVFQYT